MRGWRRAATAHSDGPTLLLKPDRPRDIDRHIASLQALRNRLTTCIGCGCLSIDRCTLLNPDDKAATLGPGAPYLHRDSRRASRS